MNGTGRFEIVAYNVGQNAVVRANKSYWGKPANLDEVEFIDLGTDSGALIAAMASGQVDGLYEVDFSELDAIKAIPDVVIHPVTTAQTAVARGKYDQKPFSDVRVRQALKLAIDQQKVIDIVFRGTGTIGEHHHVAPVHPEYAKLPMAGQDIPKAKQLLTEAGFPNGIQLEIACKPSPAWELASVTVMAEMWKAAGIDVKINVMPSANFWEVWQKVPFGYTAWTHRPLGVMVLGLAYRTGVPWNESSYSNPEFDSLLTQAEGILDPDKRRVVMAKLERLMQEDGPVVQPLWRVVQTGYNKRVKGFRMHPSQYIFLDELAVEKA
jgi:peptide/nickel transport system substrate-binding protein